MGLSDLLFARKCKICTADITSGAVCCNCRKILKDAVRIKERRIVAGGRTFSAYSLFDYNDKTVQKLLFALKRASNKELFEFCAELYCDIMHEEKECSLVYVPRSRVNKRKYGYDHMQKVVKILSKEKALDYLPLLKRRAFTKEQKKLDSAERKENVADAFKIKKNDIPMNIVLVDDVITTGSTAVSCVSTILKQNKDACVKLYFLASK